MLARVVVRVLDGPLSDHYGFDRGTPLDRPYIEAFLARHASGVRGQVLEVKDSGYSVRLGGDRLTRVEIVDVDASNPRATLVADLDDPDALAEGAYDCVLLTQVLEFLRPERALPSLYRALAPGGVMLISVPVLCRLETPDTDYARLTAAGLRRLLSELLPDAEVQVESAGNAAAAVGLLLGLAVEEVGTGVLAPDDWRFPVVVLARVHRPA